MKIRKPNINKISAIAVVALDTKIETVMRIWELAYKYKSWNLHDFMATPPSKTSVWKARRIVEELS